MARVISDSEARRVMRAAGFEPLVPYEKSSVPWKSRCLRCKKVVTPSFNNVKTKGVACPYCSGNAVHIDDVMKIIKTARLKPLVTFPGAKKPWKCECLICGGTVSPTFSSVKQGGGCKFCARKKVGLKNRTNEMEAVKIMRAAGLKPLESFVNSGTPWKCRCMKCKNVVTPRLSMVRSKKSGCAYCAGVRVDEEEALKVLKKNKLKPLEPYKGNKHPWKCIHIPCGKTVSPRYNGLQKGQGPCKYCARKAVDPDDAVALFLSKDLKPLEPYSGNNKKPWRSIHLPCGNEVSPTFNIIQSDESIGCHFCSDQFVDPDEAFQYFVSKNLQPLVPYPGTKQPWKSVHTVCGEIIQPRYGHIKAGRVGCPFCAQVIPITQERAVKFFRTNDLEPKGPFPGPHKPWKSIHTLCGREVSPRWASVQQGNGGCAYCSGNKVDMREVKALMKKLQLKPLIEYPGGKDPWKCLHIPCGEVVYPRYNGLQRGQGGCLNCGKNLVTRDEGIKLLERNNFTPLMDFPGGSKSWKVFHKPCGTQQEVFATYLRQGGKGCRFCSVTKPITSSQAKKLFKSRGFKPLEDFKNARTPLKSIHNVCGNIVSPTYSSLRSGSGCKYCSIGGINLKGPGFLYLMTHRELNAHKIGIGGFASLSNRIEQHKKHGWEPYKSLNFETAERAYEIEQEVLNWIRIELGLPQYLVIEQMPQGGHTETLDASEVALSTLWSKVEELSKLKK